MPRVILGLVLMLEHFLAERGVGARRKLMQEAIAWIVLQLLCDEECRLIRLLVFQQRFRIVVHQLHLGGVARERPLIARDGRGKLSRLHEDLPRHGFDHGVLRRGSFQRRQLGLRTFEILRAQQ